MLHWRHRKLFAGQKELRIKNQVTKKDGQNQKLFLEPQYTGVWGCSWTLTMSCFVSEEAPEVLTGQELGVTL